MRQNKSITLFSSRSRHNCARSIIYVLMGRCFLVGFAAAGRFRAAANDCSSRRSGERDGRGRRHWRNRSGAGRSCRRNWNGRLLLGAALKEMGQLRDFGPDDTFGRGRLLAVLTVRVLAKWPSLLERKKQINEAKTSHTNYYWSRSKIKKKKVSGSHKISTRFHTGTLLLLARQEKIQSLEFHRLGQRTVNGRHVTATTPTWSSAKKNLSVIKTSWSRAIKRKGLKGEREKDSDLRNDPDVNNLFQRKNKR